jgi:hypothetical protein
VTPRRSALVAGASLLLGAAVVLSTSLDLAARTRVERFVAAAGLEARRPLEVASLRLEPAADLAGAAAVEVALLDAGAPAAAPEGWLASAQELAVRSLRSRPGWPLHAHVLAEVAYRESRESNAAGAHADPQRWMTAWRAAARGAPAVERIRSLRAQACLEAWPTLPPVLRVEALEAFRAAFLDPAFVARHVGTAVDRLGAEVAIGLLPDRAEPIRTAAAALADRNLDRAKRLLDRADLAERGERAAALRRLEYLERRGDKKALSEACAALAAAYPAERFDDREERAQTARVLELWPAEPGVWESDPRAPLVRFLLDGREDALSLSALRRAVASLSDVPAPERAELLLLTGDRAGAETLRSAAAALAAHNWISYDLRLARQDLRRGALAAARRALDRLPSDQRDGCEALLVRLEVAQRSNEGAEATDLERRLAELRLDSGDGDNWLRTGRLRMCIEPASGGARSLVVLLKAAAPAIVVYGWDQSRAGTLLVSDERVLVLPLTGRPGSRVFWFAALAGGPVVPRETSIR